VGERLRALLKVVGVFLALTGIWALYRLWSVNLIIHDGQINWRMFFMTQIIFQPLLGLLPILLIVRYVEKRRMQSIGLSRDKFVRNSVFGIFLSLFESIASICLTYALFIPLGAGPLTFATNPENLDLTAILLMPATFFLVVGLSEEVQNRGYFQTRLLEQFGPKFSIAFSSLLFALSHLPIDILIWRYGVWMMSLHLGFVFIAGSIMGYLYYRSGVLTGPVFFHGLSDTLALSYTVSFDYGGLGSEVVFGIMGLLYAVVTVIILLLIRFLSTKLDLKAENLPWATAMINS
jgi:membrane protease YdiL (CAAX protease family)